jgi:hypothetical protein
VAQLGRNAHGETLEPGRVPDCYLGLLLDPTDHDTEAACVLVVAPAALLHPHVPQPDGTVLYELLTGHPDRAAHELVFLPDLTLELRAWPADTWNKVGIDPQAAARAVMAGWQRGDLLGLQLGGLTAEEALALERPAMTLARAWLRDRLAPSSTRLTGRGSTQPADTDRTTTSGSSVRGGQHRPDTDRGFGSSGRQRTLRRCPVPQPPGHRPRRGVARWT